MLAQKNRILRDLLERIARFVSAVPGGQLQFLEGRRGLFAVPPAPVQVRGEVAPAVAPRHVPNGVVPGRAGGRALPAERSGIARHF